MSGWKLARETLDAQAASAFISIESAFALDGELVAYAPLSRDLQVVIDSRSYCVKRYHAVGKNLRCFAAWGITTATVVARWHGAALRRLRARHHDNRRAAAAYRRPRSASITSRALSASASTTTPRQTPPAADHHHFEGAGVRHRANSTARAGAPGHRRAGQ